MSAINRAALVVLLNQKVLSGGKRTTAAFLRDQQNSIITSLVALIDDKDAEDGYMGIDSGRVNITFINKAIPTGSHLRDNGVWSTLIIPNAATATRLVYATSANTYGESAGLTFANSRLSPTYITLSPGTDSAGPIVFTTSGTGVNGLVSVPIRGLMEYSGYGLWMTNEGATREKVWCGLVAQSAPSTSPIGAILDYYGTSNTRVLTTPNTWFSITGNDGATYKVPGYS